MDKKKIVKAVIKKISDITKKDFSIVTDINPLLDKSIPDLKEYSLKKYGDNAEQFAFWLLDEFSKGNVKLKKFLTKNIKSLEEWKGKDYIKKYLSDINKREDIGLAY